MTFLSKANWTECTRVYAGWRWGGWGGRSGEAGGRYEGSRKGYPWWCGVQGGELGRPQFPISEAVCHTTQPLWQLRVSDTFAQLFAIISKLQSCFHTVVGFFVCLLACVLSFWLQNTLWTSRTPILISLIIKIITYKYRLPFKSFGSEQFVFQNNNKK